MAGPQIPGESLARRQANYTHIQGPLTLARLLLYTSGSLSQQNNSKVFIYPFSKEGIG